MSNIEIDNGAERSDSADSIITTEEVSKESNIALPIGTELSGQDIYQIAASEKTQMFVIIGATGSGKTTLVTSIYHLLLSGSNITDFLFAGSNTLAAFEKRAFSLRTSSMQSHGEMMRTQRGSVDSFLHLRLKLTHTDEIRNLLFSDFSGEDFESVAKEVSRFSQIEYQVSRGTLNPILEETAIYMSDGEVSDIIQTEQNYYLIRCVDDFDEVLSSENESQVFGKLRYATWSQSITSYAKEHTVGISEEIWENLHFYQTTAFTSDDLYETYDRYFCNSN